MRATAAVAACLLLAGCGTPFKLPTETRASRLLPSDRSYQMVATWTGMVGVADILLTQGPGTQLFVLFQGPGIGTSLRGHVSGYALKARPPTPAPLPGIDFLNLFNPHALCAGRGQVFVLDQGDSLLARDPATGRVGELSLTWRVRQYGLLGGDTVGTFTDTSMAFVRGIAADAQGRVYVSGSYIVNIPDPQDNRIKTRSFVFRIMRYKPVAPGSVPPDPHMPGTDRWVRDVGPLPDERPFVDEGSGLGSVDDPRGLYWVGPGALGGPAVLTADFGKNWMQKISDDFPSTGLFKVDLAQDTSLSRPEDVAVDLRGYIYLADTGNQRVLRFDPYGEFVQKVNVESDANHLPLADPVAVAADDSLVYVADRAASRVVKYQRRK